MVALNKKKLRQEIEKARRAKVKARLAELAEAIKKARAERDEAVRAVQSDCRLKREELRTACSLRRTRARATGTEEVLRRKGELGEERRYERQIREADRPHGVRKVTARARARERGQESDDEVRRDLEPDMVPVFDAVRRHIKGSPRKSRTEAFLQWAEENPGEVYDLLQRDADRYLAQLLAEQDRTQRELRRPSLAGVPF
jgi:ABC-type nitrate/sulfonate/bicarbonate transport system substrate-binding protein